MCVYISSPNAVDNTVLAEILLFLSFLGLELLDPLLEFLLLVPLLGLGVLLLLSGVELLELGQGRVDVVAVLLCSGVRFLVSRQVSE